jgi:hypothetical protein
MVVAATFVRWAVPGSNRGPPACKHPRRAGGSRRHRLGQAAPSTPDGKAPSIRPRFAVDSHATAVTPMVRASMRRRHRDSSDSAASGCATKGARTAPSPRNRSRSLRSSSSSAAGVPGSPTERLAVRRRRECVAKAPVGAQRARARQTPQKSVSRPRPLPFSATTSGMMTPHTAHSTVRSSQASCVWAATDARPARCGPARSGDRLAPHAPQRRAAAG